MDQVIARSLPSRASRLGPLSKLTIAALLGIAVSLAHLQLSIIGGLIPPLTIFAIMALLFAAIIAVGWRWAPLLGALLSGMLMAGNLEHVTYALAHPASFADFASTATITATALVGIIAGASATVQNYRSAPERRRLPRWMAFGLTGLAAFVLGALLVAAMAQEAAAGVSAEVLNSLPALASERSVFDQTEIRAKAGETVAMRLDNRDTEVHSFDIDALNVHALMPGDKSSLAIFKVSQAGTYTFYCKVPGHADLASGTGMIGTLIVEP
jgi:uncharacterized cupredoxin-like copper-binding protein